MRIRNRLADGAEEIIRHPRRTRIRQFLVGCPLIGGFVGFLAYVAAWLVSLLASPYDLGGVILVVVGMLALFGFSARSPEELVSDSVNRGMARVYAFPWIPFQLRPRFQWDAEPWRSAFIATFMFLALDSIPSTDVDLPMLVGSSLITGLAMGAILAVLKDSSSKQSWRDLLRR